MWIALIIAGGVVLTSAVAGYFDYLSKRSKGAGKELEASVRELGEKVGILEARLEEKEGRVARLESDLSFLNRLIEDKTKK